MGHVDYYPNGGWTQPGCLYNPLQLVQCNHERAHLFFIESIKSDTFKAFPCKNSNDWDRGKCKKCKNGCGKMGYHSDKSNASGTYYLDTNKKAPYGKGPSINNVALIGAGRGTPNRQ